MSDYLNQVKTEVEALSEAMQARELIAASIDRKDWERRMTPLTERLKVLLDKVPVEIKKQGLSLKELQKQLKGRYRGNVHPGELGRALRELGYLRQRSWRGGAEGGFSALWFSNT